MTNSVDPGQTASIGAVCSGSMLLASILNLSVMLGNSDDFSRRHFQMHFFLGALRVYSNWVIFHAFLSSADFSKSTYLEKKSFRYYKTYVKQSGSRLGQMSGPIFVFVRLI